MPNRFGVRSAYHQVRALSREPAEFDVRYWRPTELVEAFGRIGPVSLEVDGFFGLGIQASDANLLPLAYRVVVNLSERLRRLSSRGPFVWLRYVADSLYVRASRSR